ESQFGHGIFPFVLSVCAPPSYTLGGRDSDRGNREGRACPRHGPPDCITHLLQTRRGLGGLFGLLQPAVQPVSVALGVAVPPFVGHKVAVGPLGVQGDDLDRRPGVGVDRAAQQSLSLGLGPRLLMLVESDHPSPPSRQDGGLQWPALVTSCLPLLYSTTTSYMFFSFIVLPFLYCGPCSVAGLVLFD